ncbi:MAG TPA: hypothetical protein VHX44_04630 [Planctomycetota bacterium]|nr:hypothetical protein [Planctomycetota bacterium]
MITAGHRPQPAASDLGNLSSTAPVADSAAVTTTTPAATPRSGLSVLADRACAGVFVAVGASAGFSLVWGLALHQAPMAVSGGCAEVMCLIALLNRVFAPGSAKERAVPFLAALEERLWVLLSCLALAASSALTLMTYWPGTAG